MTTPLFPVVILAGGLATRIRPITETIPKSLVDINGKPFIDYQMRLLAAEGVKKVVLCVGYLGEMIRDYVGSGERYGLSVDYSFDGPVLLGTAGSIRKALPQLSESFFVLNGDSYLTCNYRAIQAAFEKTKAQGLMTVFRNLGLWDTSNVEYHEGKILAYDKKDLTPRMHYIDYGLGILTQTAFQYVPKDEPYDLALLNQTLLKHDQLAAFEVTERFYEIGSFTGIEDLKAYLLKSAETA